MTSLIRGRALAPALVLFAALESAAHAGAVARLRIKNGHGINVALGKTREAATGIRPEKKIWTLELDASLVGADAELRDVTPDVAGSRWSMSVASEHLVLDATRFLPGHVYRLELLRGRQLVGSALVYLYPPPAERVSRVSLEPEPEPADKGFTPAPLPKGGL
jgi:hypothetical protein